MAKEPQQTRIVERIVVEKFDGEPPTLEAPKDPVETVTIERHADGTTTHIVVKKE